MNGRCCAGEWAGWVSDEVGLGLAETDPFCQAAGHFLRDAAVVIGVVGEDGVEEVGCGNRNIRTLRKIV